MNKTEAVRNVSVFGAICVALFLSFGLVIAGTTETKVIAEKQLAPQTTCPVMGEKISKKYYADTNGKRVYFCCAMCIKTFKKNPEKYFAKLEELGQSAEAIGQSAEAIGPEKVPAAAAKCPMMNDSSKTKGCYTCPMHPEVMNKDAGKCPKCGMTLEFRKCSMDSAKAKGGCCRMKMNN
jgi:YHS domain-containing protein